MYQETQMTALRKLYNKTLWSYIGIVALSVAATAFLVVGPLYSSDQLIPWLVAAWIGLALAVVEYIVERILYKKGKKGAFLLTDFLLGILFLYGFFAETGLLGGLATLFYPLFLGFLVSRPLIPAVGLLRDAGALRDGDLSETVGRIKAGTKRKNTETWRDAYILFEDEMTHEVHLLRMSHISPIHCYRVFYLPHSGLAVGEVIPDNVTFDPFGTPAEQEVEADEQPAEKPDYTEDSYTAKPDYKEEEPTEKPWYQDPESFSNEPPKAEPKEETETTPDPNSPQRVKAAKFGTVSKVCKILAFVSIGAMFLGCVTTQSPAIIFPSFLLIFASMILSEVFKSKELKLRCTKRATAFCVDTVRRKSGKTSTRHPIVEYEVKGVTHTAELNISCSRDAVGDLYAICYDPLDPDMVRPERRGLFD